jgi:1,4-alpha-glucan branching enzyme
MNDTLRYMARDPVHRRHHHELITFGLHYAFSENFILPLSHDEVVHGKGSLLGRMPGDDWERFANLRAYYGFMWGHPGKKLLFMGGEFGQAGEWRQGGELDWAAAETPPHAGVRRLVRDLNGLYRSVAALHRRDCEAAGFEWLAADERDLSVFAWLRRGAQEDPPVAVISNFTPVERRWHCGLPLSGRWREVLNTDAALYGGRDRGNAGGVVASAEPARGQPASATLTLPPLATLFLVYDGPAGDRER